MPDWRVIFAALCGPGLLAGITLGDWLSLLRDNRFRVHPRYWSRAGFVSGSSIANSLAAWAERRRYGAEVTGTSVAPPIFVLGHWRSGTTLLHDLLSVDDRL